MSKDIEQEALREKLNREKKKLSQLIQKRTRIERDIQTSRNTLAELEEKLGY